MGMTQGTGSRGRQCREWMGDNAEWMDDIRDWCQTDVHRLSLLAQDRETWKMIIKMQWTPTGFVPMDHDDGTYITYIHTYLHT